MNLLLSIVCFLAVLHISSSTESSDEEDKKLSFDTNLLKCVNSKQCKVLYGTKPSHFSVYGFASYHQFDCLPEEGHSLCVVNAAALGLRVLPCLPRINCALLWGALLEHFKVFGHQPLCRNKKFVRCVTPIEAEPVESNSTVANPSASSSIPINNPQTTTLKGFKDATTISEASSPTTDFPSTTAQSEPLNTLPDWLSTYLSQTEEFLPTASPIISPPTEEVPDFSSSDIHSPIEREFDDGTINVHAPYAHHWSISPSTKIEINGPRPAYFNWGHANEETLSDETPEVTEAPKKNSLYDILMKSNRVKKIVRTM